MPRAPFPLHLALLPSTIPGKQTVLSAQTLNCLTVYCLYSYTLFTDVRTLMSRLLIAVFGEVAALTTSILAVSFNGIDSTICHSFNGPTWLLVRHGPSALGQPKKIISLT